MATLSFKKKVHLVSHSEQEPPVRTVKNDSALARCSLATLAD